MQVLMARRHASLAFMGGMWVFPGGTLTPADGSEAAQQLLAEPERCAFALRSIGGDPLPQSTCIALAIAACRETFEEAGILLATRKDGQPPEADQLARLHSERARLTADPMLFMAALAREELRLDIEPLVYWAHWVTPSGVGRRFDTRFFLARAPDAHAHVADTYETSECLWMSPEELLDRAARDTMRIAQPTRYTLEDLRVSLQKHGSLDALLRAEANRDVAAIMPKLIKGSRTSILLPWDPDYETTPGEGVPTDQYFESALLALPSRVDR